MKKVQIALITSLAVTALTLAACGGGGTSSGDTAAATTAPPATSTALPTESESVAADSGEITITAPMSAATTGFDPTEATAPAGKAFTITFENKDAGIPHNIVIYAGTDTSKDPLWAPDGNATVTGPDDTSYDIPALDAGTYTFVCLVHPTSMTGTLTVA
jgi:plastocyanin